MKKVYPRIYVTGETIPNQETIKYVIESLCNNTPCSVCTNDQIEFAARMCYLSFAPNVNKNVTRIREDSKEYMLNILKSGHGSVLEHTSMTFTFVDVSRIFTHELVRHRAGTAFSQTSMRYVRLEEIGMVLPPIHHHKEKEIHNEIISTVTKIEESIKKINELFDLDTCSFEEKKRFTSFIRRIAPEGIATNIVMTANLRALRHMIALRTSPAAESEIRYVFQEVFLECNKRFPNVFQDFRMVVDKYPNIRIGYDKIQDFFNENPELLYEVQQRNYSYVPEYAKV